MAAIERRAGEAIDLGGGVVVVATQVGVAQVRFRVALPPGVVIRRTTEPRPADRRPPYGRPVRRNGRSVSALPRTVGFALHPGDAVVIGGATRLKLVRIDPTADGAVRVARITVG